MAQKTAVVLGTRPEIIKMSPVIRELQAKQAEFFIIHTGQHYSYKLDGVFFEQLRLPQSRHNLEAGSGRQGEQTARILSAMERVLLEEKPDTVLVQGDTNSVLAGALAAAKLGIRVGHVEAGLRSYDRQMPEEINRVLADHCADLLFAPTEQSRQILLGEGIPDERISVTGNTIVDALQQNLELARQMPPVLPDLGLEPGKYLLATIHRFENVENRDRFGEILEGLRLTSAELGLPVLYPVHPHAASKIKEFGLSVDGIKMVEPFDFFGFLQLENQACLILTDSGGVQEEACIIRVPCVTLRDNTERPETVEVGANMLAGASPEAIAAAARSMLGKGKDWRNPLGDGTAAEKIVRLVNGR